MPNESFEQNLLRMMAGTLHFLTVMTAGREMFGRSYFSLGVAEKTAVDQAVLGFVGANYQQITPELLAAQQAQQPVGFRGPGATQSEGSS